MIDNNDNHYNFSLEINECIEEAPVVAINEPHMTCEEIVYGLRYDSEYGQFKEEIETAENKLIIGKKLITVFNEEIIENIPWSKVKVQLVAECSENVKVEDSRRHVAGTVEHVVLCSQGTGDTAPLLLV